MATVLDLDEQQPESQQSKENSHNWNANEILSQHFAQPVRFVTYTGIRDMSKIRTNEYIIWAMDTNRERVKMAKLDVLFAFPKEKMPDLKPYVKIRKSLRAENLQPIQTRADRYHVDDELLKQAKANKSNVNIVTRSGHVLIGSVHHFDKYVLYMRIGGEMVIVYRHGLLDFTIEAQSEETL